MIDSALYVATPRMRFFCRTHGEPDGIPVLLLHGSYGTGRWWERFCARLPEQIYAVAPDLRGCGQSDKADSGYAIEEQAEDVRALVEALDWTDFHLVAHSTSGAIAIEFALLNSVLLSTLTLIDSVPVEGAFTPIDTFLLLEQMKTDRELLRRAMALLMPTLLRDGRPEDADNRRFFGELVADAAQMAPAAFTEIARALNQWNRFADARQLTLPTLLVWGDQDCIVDRDATTRSLIAIPGASNLEVLRNVGHSPMIEAPQALADRFIDFITQDFVGYDEIRRTVV